MWGFILNYWIEVLLGVISLGIAGLYRTLSARVKKEIEEQQLLKAGVLAILHDRLYQSCRHYIRQGFIDVESLKNIEYMYRSYHALGGNGTGTELFKRVNALPLRETEE